MEGKTVSTLLAFASTVRYKGGVVTELLESGHLDEVLPRLAPI